MFARAFDRPNPLSRTHRFPKNPVRVFGSPTGMVAAVTLLAFAAMTIQGASAHDKGCDGNPVPVAIKLDCCGKADDHQLKPEQISRSPDGEYIVSSEGYTFVIPANKALPSNDPCSHIFFENVWMIVGGKSLRFPNTPDVYCFLTPLDF
jgi:hypothetical protein